MLPTQKSRDSHKHKRQVLTCKACRNSNSAAAFFGIITNCLSYLGNPGILTILHICYKSFWPLFSGAFASLSSKSLPICISPPKQLLLFQDLYRQVISLFFRFFLQHCLLIIFIVFFNVCLVSSFGFSGSSDNKESACNIGELGSISGSGRSPGEGTGYPLQNSCLENSMDREAREATVLGVTKNWTQLSKATYIIIQLYLLY